VCARHALLVVGAYENDLAAIASHAVNLDLWRVLGHDHDGAHPEHARGTRNGLSVVAARMCHDADLLLLVGELRERVVRAADLERAGGLEALRFDEALVAETQERGAHNGFRHARRRGPNVVDRYLVGHGFWGGHVGILP